MGYLVLAGLLGIAYLGLGACSTVAGAGQDIEDGGEYIQRKAE